MTRTTILYTAAWAVLVGHGIVACNDDPGEPALRPDCTGQSFAGVDLAGIWHFQVTYDSGNEFATAVRFDQSGEQYTTTVFGQPARSVAFDDSGLEVVVDIPVPEGQPARVVTLRACTMEQDGTATGNFAYCIGEECFPGSVLGHKIETLDEPLSSGIRVISEYNGPASGEWRDNDHISVNVRVHNNMAYVARYNDGLRVVDLADPAAPVERGHAPVVDASSEIYNDVKIKEAADGKVYALMASNLRGVVVVDVSNADDPVEVTSFPDPAQAPDGIPSVHTLFIEGDIAYLAYTAEDSLLIYDVSDPTQPQALGSYTHPDVETLGGYLHDLYVEGGRAYLNYWTLGMVIVDTLADPANPTLVGQYVGYGQTTSHSNWVTTAGGRTISVHGDEQYGAHVRIVDVDDTSVAFLDTLGSYQTRPEISVHNILAHEDKAFVTYYQDGLRVLDLQDPANPTEIAHFNTWPGAEPGYGQSFFEGALGIDFDPVTGAIYVVDTHRGLFVLALE